ncbi:hypothetical protein A5790_13895 [Mycobacterium sp. 852002-51152_SCH6134967]|uniref:hypothetical protein n=1 Tax=Mycobacterium sp. 852002-51152_SCH6134967 TaxID=1834096 RepID=UPI0007FBED54|nr:hypothetical protein [Mycobacterium sp. 852002-51152_SCH6134967]OBF92247.1 hypothetical protein A5790_13895 [Mycobacterium sp. 852002-51152_SCH6134967]
MQRRPSLLVKTIAIAAAAIVVVAGYETQAHDAPSTVIAPQGGSGPLPESRPDEPAASFGGLVARTRQATEQAAETGADLSVAVLDRNTGTFVSNGNNEAMPIASVVKLFIADDLLLQEAQGKTEITPEDRKALDAMLRSSDDSAAEIFWNRGGGSEIVSRVTARYGLRATSTPYNGRWFNTLSTTGDLVRYYSELLSGGGGLPPDKTDVIVSNLARSTPTAPDGTMPGGVYPQRFGIPEGLFEERVAVKQGWFCCWNGGNWVHWSTGAIGTDRRFVMAIASMQPADDATARDTVTQAVKTMFPGGRI